VWGDVDASVHASVYDDGGLIGKGRRGMYRVFTGERDGWVGGGEVLEGRGVEM